jgi:hypothetical protein
MESSLGVIAASGRLSSSSRGVSTGVVGEQVCGHA